MKLVLIGNNMWVLLIFWWGSYAGVSQKIENIPSEARCLEIKKEVRYPTDGRVISQCIKVQ
jgi:hypothetical protein